MDSPLLLRIPLQPGTQKQVHGMNLWGTIYNVVFMFGLPNAMGYDVILFCRLHPEAAWDILLYCLCGAVGQNFIFLTISRFGSLTNTTITTTRKFVSIAVCSLLSGNPLSEKQWGSVAMVFSGLSYQIYLKWKKLQRMQKKGSRHNRDHDFLTHVVVFFSLQEKVLMKLQYRDRFLHLYSMKGSFCLLTTGTPMTLNHK